MTQSSAQVLYIHKEVGTSLVYLLRDFSIINIQDNYIALGFISKGLPGCIILLVNLHMWCAHELPSTHDLGTGHQGSSTSESIAWSISGTDSSRLPYRCMDQWHVLYSYSKYILFSWFLQSRLHNVARCNHSHDIQYWKCSKPHWNSPEVLPFQFFRHMSNCKVQHAIGTMYIKLWSITCTWVNSYRIDVTTYTRVHLVLRHHFPPVHVSRELVRCVLVEIW